MTLIKGLRKLMNKLIESIGEDLAEKVKRETLPITELDIANPKSKEGWSLFSRVLWTMRRRPRMFFVSHTGDYAGSYVNALALMFADDVELKRKISPYKEFLFSE